MAWCTVNKTLNFTNCEAFLQILYTLPIADSILTSVQATDLILLYSFIS